MIGVGLIGYGYWGPNLLRNFMDSSEANVLAVSDLDQDRLAKVEVLYPKINVTRNYQDLIRNPNIQAIVIATPMSTHFKIALDVLKAGKHVLVEKPMTATAVQAECLIREAKKQNCVLMVDHTFVYSGAVRKIKELLSEGHIGEILYYDSVRINLGLFQHDANVMWDLAVHDLSIMDYLLPYRPCGVIANGLNHFHDQPENIAYLTFFFRRPIMAHMHVNWLAPVKLRRTLIGGSRKMIVYDDLAPSEKVMVYDRGVTMNHEPEMMNTMRIGYRTGDMWAPQFSTIEPLKVEVSHFLDCIRSGKTPITGGESGLWMVQVLEAASNSLKHRGQLVEIPQSNIVTDGGIEKEAHQGHKGEKVEQNWNVPLMDRFKC